MITRWMTVVGAVAALVMAAASPTTAVANQGSAGGSPVREVVGAVDTGGTWESVGPTLYPHGFHVAVGLRGGDVLVAGGSNRAGRSTAKAEIFDPSTDTWQATAPMHLARARFAAVRLADGRVLVAGGVARNHTDALASAEVYNPTTGKWAVTGSMTQARRTFDAILLPSGKVLAVGGWPSFATPFARRTAELYDPVTGTWSRTGSMRQARASEFGHILAPLPHGRVLVAGGDYTHPSIGYEGRASAEIYHPATGTWTGTDDLSFPGATNLVALADGRILAPGGVDGTQDTVAKVDVYDPVSRTWSAAHPMHVARQSEAATLLPDGRVLVAGGCNSDTLATLRSAEVYDPVRDQWTRVQSLPQPASWPQAVTLPDGTVLVVGGVVITRIEGTHMAAIFTE